MIPIKNTQYRLVTTEDAEQVTRLTDQLGYSASAAETAVRITHINDHPDHCAFVAALDTHVVGWIHS